MLLKDVVVLESGATYVKNLPNMFTTKKIKKKDKNLPHLTKGPYGGMGYTLVPPNNDIGDGGSVDSGGGDGGGGDGG